jgi:PhnB protein
MQVQAHLDFNGRCEEALEFYKKAIGAEVVMLVRFKDMPDPKPPGMIESQTAEKIMHARFRVGETVVLASDGRCTGKGVFEGIALSITADNEAQAERLFTGLADGGQVRMPLAKTFFSPRFGMLADRFGIGWMVYVEP